jgi:hypothetical protein
MKHFTALWILVAAACGVTADAEVGPPPDGKSDDAHVQATNCELFIDKVSAFDGSHGLRAVSVWVKLLPERLDDEVVEVGFRNRADSGPWSDLPLRSFFGAGDYFTTTLTLRSDFGGDDYEGAFYVRTRSDTNYWFKPLDGGNFFFDIGTYDYVTYVHGANHSSSIDYAAATQQDAMTYFNPTRCY